MKSAGLSIAVVTAAAVAAGTLPAAATDGYFSNGFGARQKALAGAGVADGQDATTASLNPAGLVHAEDQLNASVSVFSPRRSFDTHNSALFPQGETESGSDYFAIPNLAYSTRAYANPLFDVIGFTVYGNGGMNTNYKDGANAKCNQFGPGTGPLCRGAFGVNLQQMLISVAMAKQVMPGLSVGVAPILARQQIEVEGLGIFDAFPTQQGAVNLSSSGPIGNNGTNVAWGGGLRYGVEWAPMSTVRLGVAGNTRIWSEPFSSYRGLFAEQGDFDIPASIQAGIAVDVTPQLTLMLDYKHIWYSDIASVGNEGTQAFLRCFGTGGAAGNSGSCLGDDNGPGFGWKDISIIKVGAEWQATPELALRAGYSWNQNPIDGSQVFFNTLAPAVVQHHITAGLKYDIDANYSVELAGMYVPRNSVSGADPLAEAFAQQQGQPSPNSRIEIEMHQFEITGGLVYRWGAPAAPLK